MRMSRYLIPTLKEDPADAEVISHKLMLRAGMIRKLTAGVYSYLPLGLRSLKKVERIVREEMDAAGAQEVFLPAVQPAELWEESGRWDVLVLDEINNAVKLKLCTGALGQYQMPVVRRVKCATDDAQSSGLRPGIRGPGIDAPHSSHTSSL